MLKKLHRKLTLLCTLITSIIVILMTSFSIYISESGLRQKEFASFTNYVNGIYSHLQIETTITLDWIRNVEKNGKYILSIVDNGNPLKLTETDQPKNQYLIEKAKTTAAVDYQFNPFETKPSKVLLKHIEFFFQDQDAAYYSSAAYIPKEHGALSVIILYSLDSFHQSIVTQRCIYLAVGLLAILSLYIFSYFFTKNAIRPVVDGQEKQERFIAAASHELRSPLTVIRSSLSAIKKADESKVQRFEHIIQSEIDRMSRLISDMLLLSGIGGYSWSLKEEAVDINLFLRDIYDSYQEIVIKKNLKIRLEINKTSESTVFCDRQRMGQVLYILLNNAISYTPSGGSIIISSKLKGRKCIISVTDTGIGISDDNKIKIFERFYRVDQSHKSKEHFGLGLCIAEEIVKLHKGNIEITDTPGGGATFHIFLSAIGHMIS